MLRQEALERVKNNNTNWLLNMEHQNNQEIQNFNVAVDDVINQLQNDQRIQTGTQLIGNVEVFK